ncbi:MAG TPA: hypothetical protein VMH02_13345 [Verrucomicrobiae bacterium]|nr:hypothetical protein [Verrucomicrobiae bacterium]
MPLLALLSILVAQAFGSLPIDGIPCQASEGAVLHIHAQLQLYERGKSVTVPEGVGISQLQGCLYWLHTHTSDGFIHIESPVQKSFTLGEFFDIWGQDLSWTKAASVRAPRGKRLAIWVDGRPWHGRDPNAIVLKDQETIVIQSGPPFAQPLKPDWSKL